jgi:hypothetical protein
MTGGRNYQRVAETHYQHGEDRYNWTGDDAGYEPRHKRVRKLRGKAAGPCEQCAEMAGIFEWAQVHDSDGLDPMDYMSLCHACHSAYDSKLSDVDVAEIRALWQKPDHPFQYQIGEMYGIDQGYVSNIVNFKRWNLTQLERV